MKSSGNQTRVQALVGKYDVLVAGAGPAGCALVGELARRGLSVSWIAPDIDTVWPNAYGAWVDDFPRPLQTCFSHRWDGPQVAFFDTFHRLEAVYGRVSNEDLKHHLLKGTSEVLRLGRRLEEADLNTARIVVDATGFQRALSGGKTPDPAFQTAFGIVAEVSGEPIDGHDMCLMDYRDVPQEDWSGPATFLYAMRLDQNLWFLEETVLAARPAVSVATLKERLELRLKLRGVKIHQIHDEERCVIPMGEPLPEKYDPLPFGASASFVHPATGYSLSRSLRSAPKVAEAIQLVLDGSSIDLLSSTVWPAELKRARTLHQFGLDVLLGMSPEDTRRFFDAFFKMPPQTWRGYLSDAGSQTDVVRGMWAQFLKVSPHLKLVLGKAALSKLF